MTKKIDHVLDALLDEFGEASRHHCTTARESDARQAIHDHVRDATKKVEPGQDFERGLEELVSRPDSDFLIEAVRTAHQSALSRAREEERTREIQLDARIIANALYKQAFPRSTDDIGAPDHPTYRRFWRGAWAVMKTLLENSR